MPTYQTTDGEVTDLANRLLVCDVGKPCFLCGSSEGELFSSTAENHPFHKPCIDGWRGELVGNLNTMIDIVEEELKPRHVRAWTRIKLWLAPATSVEKVKK